MTVQAIGISISEEAPRKLVHQRGKASHCAFLGKSRKQEEGFYVESSQISCPLARYQLGLDPPEEKTRTMLINALLRWEDMKDGETAKRFLEGLSVLPFREKKHITYLPLSREEEALQDPEPDVVILIGTAREIFELALKNTYQTGAGIEARMAAVGAICGECTAFPLVKNRANISVGCEGSRREVDLKEEELFMAMPFWKYRELEKKP